MVTGQEFIDSCHQLRQAITGRKVQQPVAMMPLDLPDLPESWAWTSLSSLCERVSVGHVGPTSEYFCQPPNGIPFIRSQDVRPGKLTLGNVAHVVEAFHDKLKKSQLKPGDILIVRVGANRGDCCVVPDGLGSMNCANIVFARPLIPNLFLGFFFNSDFGQSLLSSLTTGSAQGVLNTQSIATIPVPVPPLHLQLKIASILSAYDDLIENNTRRIAILEEMAQAIYREWFVNFRFPGHENVKLVDSPLGMIPEGWEIVNLFDVAEITYGFPYKSKQFSSEPIGNPVIRIRDVLGHKSHTYTLEEAGSKYLVNNGDILIGMDGDFHMCRWAGGKAVLNQRVALLRTRGQLPQYTLFHAVKEPIAHFNATIVGTTVAHLGDKHLREILVRVPHRSLQASVHKIFQPIFEEEINLRRKNQLLRTTRDLLLPKLISGELDVEDLDIDTGLAADELHEVTA